MFQGLRKVTAYVCECPKILVDTSNQEKIFREYCIIPCPVVHVFRLAISPMLHVQYGQTIECAGCTTIVILKFRNSVSKLEVIT